MIKILFVNTTNVNVGDLVFCLEWVNELRPEDFRFAFVIDRSMQQYMSPEDTVFFFSPARHVKCTIVDAVRAFKADVIIFACNSYWNMKGQKGAVRGEWHEDILNLNIPILSFDPLEGLTEIYVRLWDVRVSFPLGPDNVWSLRASPNLPEAPKTKHYRIRKRFERLPVGRKFEVLKDLGVDLQKKTAFFAIAKNTYYDARKIFHDYYAYLASLLQSCHEYEIQFLVLAPERILEFDANSDVIQIGHQPNDRFVEILKACDLYVTDNGIACSFVQAMACSIPSLILCNSFESLDDVPLHQKAFKGFPRTHIEGRRSFVYDGLYPYKVFPYGMITLFNHDQKRYHWQNCYCQAEVFKANDLMDKLEALVHDTKTRRNILNNCAAFQARYRKLPSPAEILAEVLA
ncbi:DUF6365 family protein [candidate division CSSED10-310 bacterium]|uniref:DUF6365 family protein n=1 Tax=candidate division CSSED10-310 bacterium TaxID=2855610 RepID=A0ABV6YQU3_UNCC1